LSWMSWVAGWNPCNQKNKLWAVWSGRAVWAVWDHTCNTMWPSSQCGLHLSVAREPGFRCSLRSQCGLHLNVACILMWPGPWAYCGRDLGMACISMWPSSQYGLHLSVACTSVWPENRDFGVALGLSVACMPMWPASQCSPRTEISVWLEPQRGQFLNVAFSAAYIYTKRRIGCR